MKALKKRLPYIVFLVTVMVVMMELLPYIMSPLLYQQSFSRKKTKEKLMSGIHVESYDATENAEEETAYLGDHILHPYFGFISRPGPHRNSYSFLGPDPLEKSTENTLRVCVMGGSVAMGLYNHSADKLLETLQSMSPFSHKNISLNCFALGGYKQPQQLLILNYFLSQGAICDIVINLDGFNEVVLPYSDNLPFEIHHSYPRHWQIYSRKKLDIDVQLLLSQQLAQRNDRLALAQKYQKKPLVYSNFCLLLWLIQNNKYEMAIHETELELREALINSESNYQSTGPFVAVTDTTSFFAEQVDVWANSSIMMAALSKGMGFNYFHFLQPNQYVEGSKVLTHEELTNAFEDGEFPYKEAVQKAYPMLIKRGQQLADDGVNFGDLTMIFEQEVVTVYIDKCCHFNKKGYDAIALHIGQRIAGALEENGILE